MLPHHQTLSVPGRIWLKIRQFKLRNMWQPTSKQTSKKLTYSKIFLINVKFSVFQAGTPAWNPSSHFQHTFKAEERQEHSMWRASQESWVEVSKAAADFNHSQPLSLRLLLQSLSKRKPTNETRQYADTPKAVSAYSTPPHEVRSPLKGFIFHKTGSHKSM